MNPSSRQNGLHLRGPLLHATLERDRYGAFRTKNSRLQLYGYKPDIPLPVTIDVVCLVILRWDKGYEGKMGLGKLLPGCAGLMLVPSVSEAFTYERVGVWYPERYTGEVKVIPGDIKVTPADFQSFRLV